MKPRIVIHPGLPKCATSTIQRAFVLENHQLARELGVEFLSAGFQSNNGYPDVVRVMDDPQAYLADLATADFPAARYFLSSEALLKLDLSTFSERFDVERWALTVRMPMLQAVSNYRYSGWTGGPFQTSNICSLEKLDAVARRQIQKAINLREQPGALVIVPVEAAQGGIAQTFCQAVFGRVPEFLRRLSADALQEVNPSISFAFADALGRRLAASGLTPVDAPLRRKLVNAARDHTLDRDLRPLVPQGLAESWSGALDGPLERYRELLTVSPADRPVEPVLDAAGLALNKLINAPSPNADQARRLDVVAAEIIAGCTADTETP